MRELAQDFLGPRGKQKNAANPAGPEAPEGANRPNGY